MTRFRSPAMFALGVLCALVLVGSAAYAANGGALILGRGNAASAPTGLSNPRGTALALNARRGAPPLTVNSGAKVSHFNADMIDGVDSKSLALVSGRTGIIEGSSTDVDGLPITARCPKGTIETGGGGAASTTGDHLSYSGPDFNPDTGALIPNSWLVLSDTPAGTVAFVVCYNPRGTVPGARTSLAVPGGRRAFASEAKRRLATHAR